MLNPSLTSVAQQPPLSTDGKKGPVGSSSRAFLNWLVDSATFTPAIGERLERVQRETGDGLARIILKTGLLSESALATELVQFTTLPALSPECLPIEPVNIADLSSLFLRTREIVPLRMTEGALEVACWDALDDIGVAALQFSLGCNVERQIGTRTQIAEALDRLYPANLGGASPDRGQSAASEEEEVDRLKDLTSDAPAIRRVQSLINEAVTARASDIHLEPTDRGLVVRYRLDGLLKEAAVLPPDQAASIVSRIKVMAGLNIAERPNITTGRGNSSLDTARCSSVSREGESVWIRMTSGLIAST